MDDKSMESVHGGESSEDERDMKRIVQQSKAYDDSDEEEEAEKESENEDAEMGEDSME